MKQSIDFKQYYYKYKALPLRNSIIPHYITIDTNVILSIFKTKGESK